MSKRIPIFPRCHRVGRINSKILKAHSYHHWFQAGERLFRILLPQILHLQWQRVISFLRLLCSLRFKTKNVNMRISEAGSNCIHLWSTRSALTIPLCHQALIVFGITFSPSRSLVKRKWAHRVQKAANCGRLQSDLWMTLWWQTELTLQNQMVVHWYGMVASSIH